MVFQKDQSAAGFQASPDSLQHALGPREFVVDVHQHNQIELACGQFGIAFAAKNRDNIFHAGFGGFGGQLVEHAALNIVGINQAGGAYELRHANAVVTGACAHISDHHSGFKIKLSNGVLRLFFPFPFFTIKPLRAPDSHNRCNRTARNRMNRLARHFAATAQQQKQAGCGHRTSTLPTLSLHSRLDASIRVSVALAMANFTILANQSPNLTPQNPLQVVAAGVETSEDAPFVPSDYRFLPGDYVYFQFQISGYAVQTRENSDIRKMSLTYEATPQDDKGIALTTPITDVIEDDLSPEDKNWTPKRRGSFLLPSFIAAGDFHVHVLVNDLLSHKSTERDLPFRLGGTVVAPTSGLTVQDFQFLRKEDGQPRARRARLRSRRHGFRPLYHDRVSARCRKRISFELRLDGEPARREALLEPGNGSAIDGQELLSRGVCPQQPQHHDFARRATWAICFAGDGSRFDGSADVPVETGFYD